MLQKKKNQKVSIFSNSKILFCNKHDIVTELHINNT